MISAIVTTLYSVALIVASFFYLRARYRLCEKGSLREVAVKNIKYLILTVIVFAAMITVEFIYAVKQGPFAVEVLMKLMKWSTLFWGLYLIAKVDFHEKKIPNELGIAMLILRGGFLAYEVIANLAYWKTALGYPILGAAIGGMIMVVGKLFSRKGVGVGDIKMFIIIGAFVGSAEILSTMFYTFFVSAIAGIFLLMTKKAGLRDSVPMAPFACIGVALEYLLLMIGG